MRFVIAVLLMGIIMSPMNFHLYWLTDLMAGPREVPGLVRGFSQGILIFASLVIAVDVYGRTYEAKSREGQFCRNTSVIAIILIAIVLISSAGAIQDQEVQAWGVQAAIFLTVLSLSAFSSVIPVKNSYVSSGRLR